MNLTLKVLAKKMDLVSLTGNVSDLQMDGLIPHYSIVSVDAIVIGAEIRPEGAKLEIRGRPPPHDSIFAMVRQQR